MATATKRKKSEQTTQGNEPANLQSDEQLAASLQDLECEVEVATVRAWNRQQWAEAAGYVDRMAKWVDGGQMLSAPVPPEFLKPYQSEPAEHPGHNVVQEIPTSQLQARFNPRKNFDAGKIADLAASLEKHGQLQEILVKPGAKGTFDLIAGERRWRAAKKAKLPKVRCRVLDITDEEAIELAGIENIEREDLDPVEEAGWYQVLIDQCGYTQRSLGKRLKRSQSHIALRLGLLKLPEAWQQRVMTGAITPTLARELLPFVKRPAVLEALSERLRPFEQNLDKPLDETTFGDELRDAIAAVSRHAGGAPVHYHGDEQVLFKVTEKRAGELDVEEFTLHGRKTVRAFNVDRWQELQKDAKKRRRDKEKAERERIRAEFQGGSSGKNKKEPQGPDGATMRRHLVWWHQLALAERLQAMRPKKDLLWPLAHMLIEDRFELYEQLGGQHTPMANCADEWQVLSTAKPAQLRDAVVALLNPSEAGLPPFTRLTLDEALVVAPDFGVEVRKQWQPDDELLQEFPVKRLRQTSHDVLAGNDFSQHDKESLVEALREKWPPGRMLPEVAEVLKEWEAKDDG